MRRNFAAIQIWIVAYFSCFCVFSYFHEKIFSMLTIGMFYSALYWLIFGLCGFVFGPRPFQDQSWGADSPNMQHLSQFKKMPVTWLLQGRQFAKMLIVTGSNDAVLQCEAFPLFLCLQPVIICIFGNLHYHVNDLWVAAKHEFVMTSPLVHDI